MCQWVYFAGSHRLKHLALMRSSAASRRFAWLIVAMSALSLGVLQLSIVGWRGVTSIPAVEATGSITPVGQLWRHVASRPRPLPAGLAPQTIVDFWWNPAQSITGFVLGLLGGGLSIWLFLWLMRVGILKSHSLAYRHEQRMSAAIHYGCSWLVPLAAACGVMLLFPLVQGVKIAGWFGASVPAALTIVASIMTAIVLILWWFWLLRLAATAPKDTRQRVVAFMAIGAPAIVTGLAFAWWYGVGSVQQLLFKAMRIDF